MNLQSEVEKIPKKNIRLIQKLLIEWAQEYQTPFPWQDNLNPYYALVAGVCAQQTQMSRILEIFDRWIVAFPTIAKAANASRAEVLTVWGNAGYPRRAVNLHKTLQICINDHAGIIPCDEESLIQLPGVGPFTTAIIQIFGYGMDKTAIDTNITRIYGRLFCGDLQPINESDPKLIQAIATQLLPTKKAHIWNPTLMDFGATICTAKPKCNICILKKICLARPKLDSGVTLLPTKKSKTFKNSNRYWRGKILKILREKNSGFENFNRENLIESLSKDLDTQVKLNKLIDDLAKEELIWLYKNYIGLGDHPISNNKHSNISHNKYVDS